jgi:hypothetical protein
MHCYGSFRTFWLPRTIRNLYRCSLFMWGVGTGSREAYHNHCSIFKLAVEMASRPNCTIKTCKQAIMSLHQAISFQKNLIVLLCSVQCDLHFLSDKNYRLRLVLMPKRNAHLSQPQSRQSTRLFSQSSELGPLTPSP